jgi:hypothetical protein
MDENEIVVETVPNLPSPKVIVGAAVAAVVAVGVTVLIRKRKAIAEMVKTAVENEAD